MRLSTFERSSVRCYPFFAHESWHRSLAKRRSRTSADRKVFQIEDDPPLKPSAIVLLTLFLLLSSCSYPFGCGGSTWFRRCGAPIATPEQTIEYSVQRVDEPLPWRLCYRTGVNEPWVQVSGSPGFASEEEARRVMLEALRDPS